MGKTWEHVCNLLLIGAMVIARELNREMDSRKFDPKRETQKELDPLYNKIFGKPKKCTNNKK